MLVFTDYNPLVFLDRMRNNNQRLMRWSLILEGHNLEIRHIRGRENVVADALSWCSYYISVNKLLREKKVNHFWCFFYSPVACCVITRQVVDAFRFH